MGYRCNIQLTAERLVLLPASKGAAACPVPVALPAAVVLPAVQQAVPQQQAAPQEPAHPAQAATPPWMQAAAPAAQQ
ncbi:hypothetical protein Vid5_gp47 [Pantoea phage vB_PagS_Vid5]|uniref:Uncharacterized protein n=1 Tax=Pantoea phage vB_PagS_Vid5 TaxID=2099652 RepID=A0A2P1CKT2_9CAUD|nr:hypothetical protein FDJ45_gp047 [Pantoea phage vB_PagS_Vid5]AVJ51802.1 hypothetical protein Vid5_gp47 [Pantoea phage vB_PagS_Vid5]